MVGAAKNRMKKDAERARQQQRAVEDAAAQQLLQPKRNTGYDGPADSSTGGPPSRGRPESTAPSVGQPVRGQSQVRAPSQGPSQGRASSQIRGTSTQMLPDRKVLTDARRFAARFIDLPGNAYTIGDGLGEEYSNYRCIARPAHVTAGKPAQVVLNSHRVKSFPQKTIYQYDVVIGTGLEKRIIVRKAWESQAVQSKLPGGIIFDGNKLAWHFQDFTGPQGEIRFDADLDHKAGQPAPPQRQGPSKDNNKFRIVIKKTAVLNTSVLQSYLAGQTDLSESVINTITFLDHLLRETPSKKMINLRRSFFDRMTAQRAPLGFGVEAMKGVYQSMRAANGGRMVINVDVSNAVFWNESSLMLIARELTRAGSVQQMVQMCAPVRLRQDQGPSASNAMIQLRKLKKNEFVVRHKGRNEKESAKLWKVKNILEKNARNFTFQIKDRATRQPTGPPKSIEQYYLEKYNLRLEFPLLPLIETTKKDVVYPMELCFMTKGQRYPYKLNEDQTSAMIKFAVERPDGRKASIEKGLQLLDWENDNVLKNYGVSIEREQIKTNARVLDPPTILFGKGGKVEPKYSGRWDLRNKTFLLPNNAPLVSWGVCVFPGRNAPNTPLVQTFIKSFIAAYRGHGGNVQKLDPPIVTESDPAKAVERTWLDAGNAAKKRPQMLVFILPDKNADVYLRIKKSCDCRYGVVSQCMQGAHVQKNNPQYHSNVSMKFNAKLGGTTNKTLVKGASGPMVGHFSKPTMIIGCDVSHAAPGSEMPSTAAMTMSLDMYASRYAAAVQTNPPRVEMLATHTIEKMMTPLFHHWAQNVGKGIYPVHVYYFRDGVSAAQYGNVMKYEVAALKALLGKMNAVNKNYKVNFTVIVAEKRHHTRFFPTAGFQADKNGNPVPGTVVDRDVTHPFEYDFFLNSHSAIQGTARPTHYHVLQDEEKQDPNKLITMVYEHSYQYMRATTPVSLHPAVYYAHLASNRARSHEDKHWRDIVNRASGDTSSEDKQLTEVPGLLPMDNTAQIDFSMWYI